MFCWFDLSQIARELEEEAESQRYADRAAGLAGRLGMVQIVKRVSEERPVAELTARLTKRERTVVSLLVAGRSDKEIAAELGLSTYTASNHVRHIREKLNCPTRAEVVATALRLGIAE